MNIYDLMVSIYPGILADWVDQIVISLDRMLIVQSQVGSLWSNIVEETLVTQSQLPCVATPLHTQHAICVMNHSCGTRRVKVLLCCSRHNAELRCRDFPRTDSDVFVTKLFPDFLQEYGRPVLHALCGCTWRHARVLFATNSTLGYSLLSLPPCAL